MNCERPWYENEWEKGESGARCLVRWSVCFMLMRVFRAEESIAEVDAAPAQVRREARGWCFGDQELPGRQRDVENRTVVGGMRRPVETPARVPGLRCVGVQQRNGLERLVDLNPELLRLAVPGKGGHAWAEFRPWFESTLVDTAAAILEVLGEHAIRRHPGDHYLFARLLRRQRTLRSIWRTVPERARPPELPEPHSQREFSSSCH